MLSENEKDIIPCISEGSLSITHLIGQEINEPVQSKEEIFSLKYLT